MSAADIARMLAERIEQFVLDLLPAGHREGHELRAGSIAGEPGNSLGVHLAGAKAGVWSDFSTGVGGDALDLVRAVLSIGHVDALSWSRRWLQLDDGEAAVPRRSAPPAKPEPEADPLRWRRPWQAARPINGTAAERYLTGRNLHFDDAEGRVLRFAERRARLSPDGEFQHHPALLAALCDARTGEQVGIINVYLAVDGSDRIRDSKGKTATGRAKGAAVMLSAFDEPTLGLVICEGVETGIAILMTDLAPVWACGGAGTLATFPVLGGIECLTIAADADETGRKAGATCTARWREAGRETRIVTPPGGDWADPT
jgi:Toprim domain